MAARFESKLPSDGSSFSKVVCLQVGSVSNKTITQASNQSKAETEHRGRAILSHLFLPNRYCYGKPGINQSMAKIPQLAHRPSMTKLFASLRSYIPSETKSCNETVLFILIRSTTTANNLKRPSANGSILTEISSSIALKRQKSSPY
jgi:hypothetical protein